MLKTMYDFCLKDLAKAVKLLDEAQKQGARHADLYYYRGALSFPLSFSSLPILSPSPLFTLFSLRLLLLYRLC